jgi:hypothetical protein
MNCSIDLQDFENLGIANAFKIGTIDIVCILFFCIVFNNGNELV